MWSQAPPKPCPPARPSFYPGENPGTYLCKAGSLCLRLVQLYDVCASLQDLVNVLLTELVGVFILVHDGTVCSLTKKILYLLLAHLGSLRGENQARNLDYLQVHTRIITFFM